MTTSHVVTSTESGVSLSEYARHSDGEVEPGRGRRGNPVLWLIRVYQLARGTRPSPCRFMPTCSQYAQEAIVEHGTIRGGALAVRRIARCHPWGGHGFDPVPVREDSR